MNIEKYSERVRGFIQSAQTMALSRNQPAIHTEHMLKVLVDDEEGLAASLIGPCRRTFQGCNGWLSMPHWKPCPRSRAAAGQLYLAQPLAKGLRHGGGTRQGRQEIPSSPGTAAHGAGRREIRQVPEILSKAGVTPVRRFNRVSRYVERARTADSASAEQGYDALKKYARDLTADASAPAARSGHRPRRRDPPHDARCCRAGPRNNPC